MSSFQTGFTVQIQNPPLLWMNAFLERTRCHFQPRSPVEIFRPHMLFLHCCPAWLKQLPTQLVIHIYAHFGSLSIKCSLNFTQGLFFSPEMPKHLDGSLQYFLHFFSLALLHRSFRKRKFWQGHKKADGFTKLVNIFSMQIKLYTCYSFSGVD